MRDDGGKKRNKTIVIFPLSVPVPATIPACIRNMEVSQPGATASSSPPVITLKIIYHRQKIFRVTFYSGTYQSGYVDKISAKMLCKNVLKSGILEKHNFGCVQTFLIIETPDLQLWQLFCCHLNLTKVVCTLTPSRADVRPTNSYYANIFTANLNKNICDISHVKCCVTLSTEGQCQ